MVSGCQLPQVAESLRAGWLAGMQLTSCMNYQQLGAPEPTPSPLPGGNHGKVHQPHPYSVPQQTCTNPHIKPCPMSLFFPPFGILLHAAPPRGMLLPPPPSQFWRWSPKIAANLYYRHLIHFPGGICPLALFALEFMRNTELRQ